MKVLNRAVLIAALAAAAMCGRTYAQPATELTSSASYEQKGDVWKSRLFLKADLEDQPYELRLFRDYNRNDDGAAGLLVPLSPGEAAIYYSRRDGEEQSGVRLNAVPTFYGIPFVADMASEHLVSNASGEETRTDVAVGATVFNTLVKAGTTQINDRTHDARVMLWGRYPVGEYLVVPAAAFHFNSKDGDVQYYMLGLQDADFSGGPAVRAIATTLADSSAWNADVAIIGNARSAPWGAFGDQTASDLNYHGFETAVCDPTAYYVKPFGRDMNGRTRTWFLRLQHNDTGKKKTTTATATLYPEWIVGGIPLLTHPYASAIVSDDAPTTWRLGSRISTSLGDMDVVYQADPPAAELTLTKKF